MILSKRVVFWLLFAAAPPLRASDWTLEVEHARALRNRRGVLTVGSDAIAYRGDREKEPLVFEYSAIQQLKLELRWLEILTYSDSRWLLGRDRRYRFKITGVEADPGLAEFLRSRVTGVFVSAIAAAPEETPAYSIQVKHLGIVEGSEGVLEMYAGRVLYRTAAPGGSRTWTYGQIESFAMPSRRQLELLTDEKKRGGPTRTFRFQLKQAAPETLYDFLWPRVHGARAPAG